MRRAVRIEAAGSWPAGEAVASVTLAFDERHRRRIRLTDDRGEDFLLDLEAPALLAQGDGMALDEGGYIEVRAADEPVADIQCEDATHAARLAWHIGNRHAPVQLLGEAALRIGDDHVLVGMVEGLGGKVRRHMAPFAPEPGAYEGGGHGH
jgi:urease accessory protein